MMPLTMAKAGETHWLFDPCGGPINLTEAATVTAGTVAAVTKTSNLARHGEEAWGQFNLLMPFLVGEEQFYGKITGSPSSLSAGDLRIG